LYPYRRASFALFLILQQLRRNLPHALDPMRGRPARMFREPGFMRVSRRFRKLIVNLARGIR